MRTLINNWIGKFTYVYNIGTKFYFNTNYKAPKGRIVMIDLKYYDAKNPELTLFEVIPQHEKYILKKVKCVGGKLAVVYMQDASDRLYIYDYSVPAKLLNSVDLPKIMSIYNI